MLSAFKNYFQKTFRGVNFARPIPEGKPMDGWKNTQLDPSHPARNEPLVPLGLFSDYPEVFSDGVYFGERETSPYAPGELDGALLTSFVRKGVAERLKRASKLLPSGYALMTLDTLRTEAVQNSLFQNFKNQLTAAPHNRSEAEAIEETQTYVSLPSQENSPHLTGGAVDLALVRFEKAAWKEMKSLTRRLKKIAADETRWKEAYTIEMRRSQLLREQRKMLNMGVVFDEVAQDAAGEDKTALRYFELELTRQGSLKGEALEALKNRRMLYNVLDAVGIPLYPGEPWHGDLGNKFAAQQQGLKTSFYGYAPLSKDNKRFEEIRRGHYFGTLRLRETPISLQELRAPSTVQEIAHAAAHLFGSLRESRRPEMRAHRISPPVPTAS